MSVHGAVNQHMAPPPWYKLDIQLISYGPYVKVMVKDSNMDCMKTMQHIIIYIQNTKSVLVQG